MVDNMNTDGWIRPLGKFESYLELFHQKGFMISSYSLTLNSKSPLDENHLKKTLIHLQRKTPNLSVCIRPKSENELWFHKMETENIDFKILENVQDIQKEFEDLSRHHYNSFDGPLWCVRLIPQPLDSSCAMPEIKLQYPHQYVLLIGFHHAITDGTSNIKICNALLMLLNDVIAANPINDMEKIGEHISSEETEKYIFPCVNDLISNPAEQKQIQELTKEGIDEVLFLKAFPSPANETKQTVSLSYSLSKEETSRFLKRCKQEGVTFHTAFCSIVNAAIVELLKSAGIEKETFLIKSYHTINARRFWNRDSSQSLGAHLLSSSIASELSSQLKEDDFWNNVRTFHSNFTFQLTNKGPLKEAAATYLLLQSEERDTKTTERFTRPFYYGTTNMGNMTSTFSGEGDHVQVTDFKRTTSTVNNLCSHVMQTFRGRFIYSIDYERQLMSKETAQLYVDTIFKVLRKVTNISE